MSRPDNAVNEQHLQAPKPGDMWHERFCPYHIVLAVTERGLIVADKTKREGPCHYSFDLDSAKEITHEEHRNIVRYRTHDGFVADVVPERCLGAVEEWIAAGKKHIALAEAADAQLPVDADRELLELAAKAAGKGPVLEISGRDVILGPNSQMRLWRPLDDDGDALRLAVQLRIEIIYSGNSVRTVVRGSDGKIVDICECLDPRRAIVMAAAVIGRLLP